MIPRMLSLPIDAHLGEIIEGLRAHRAMVIVAAPGAGKTTRVPPAIVTANVLAPAAPHVIMLQPRRVAARAAAERIAQERAWRLGGQVGYHIRFEKRYGADTRIRILTEAILTRMLLDDPYLEGIGCVILDEFHERNIHTDLAIAFLREVQQTVRPDLKLVVMSATLDARPVAEFLGGEGGAVPVMDVAGRTFPVEIAHRPGSRDVPLETQVRRAADEALAQQGDVLVFLPGVREIDFARRALLPLEQQNVAVLSLHGSLAPDEQQRALVPDPRGRRKIILATNIAETSLTIDGVRTVIDSGLARVASFDADRGMDRLDLEAVSQASAAQRAGRAGRQGPGRAYRLWSAQDQAQRPAFALPEVRRVDLAPTVLAVHAWGAHPETFGWFEKPEAETLAAADALLDMLGALKARGADGARLTERGRRMLKVPAHPRIARLLTAAAGTPLEQEAVALAAALADDSRGAQTERLRAQLAGIARGLSREPGDAPREADLLLLAYPDRVARRRESDAHAAVMVGNIGLRLAAEALTPAVAAADLFIATDVQHDARNRRAEGLVRHAAPLALETLERLFPGQLHEQAALEYDAAKEKVVAVERRLYRDLLLQERPHGHVDKALAGEILAAALTPRAREIFRADEAAERLLARLALVRACAPEASWPALSLGELLAAACEGKRSLAEVMAPGHLGQTIRAALLYPLDRRLEEFAPETLAVPSGSNIRLAYTLPSADDATPAAPPSPPPPILAVRLQELFGWTQTPRICGGRVPVLLHLLSPGYKPIQITSDLASFWRSAYFEVRKDLRARYPKHKWPDDPLSAAPEAKGRRR